MTTETKGEANTPTPQNNTIYLGWLLCVPFFFVCSPTDGFISPPLGPVTFDRRDTPSSCGDRGRDRAPGVFHQLTGRRRFTSERHATKVENRRDSPAARSYAAAAALRESDGKTSLEQIKTPSPNKTNQQITLRVLELVL